MNHAYLSWSDASIMVIFHIIHCNIVSCSWLLLCSWDMWKLFTYFTETYMWMLWHQLYLLQIHKSVNALSSVWYPVPLGHHVILEGILLDYAYVITLFKSKFCILVVYEFEVLLIAHDLNLYKYKKDILNETISLDPTCINTIFTSHDTSHSLPMDSPPSQSTEQNYNSFKGNSYHGGRWNSGRGSHYPNVEGQVCSMFSNIYFNCWHVFNNNLQPSRNGVLNENWWQN